MRFCDWAYQNGWYFFLYAFADWAAEVLFAAFRHGRFVNRGFLCGPLCPIYGIGLVLVALLLEPLGNHWVQLFLVAAALTTGVELVAGYLMEKLFHHRWWDYSAMPLNIGGYVCLPFSLLWGAACVLIEKVVHPLVVRFVAWIPHGLGAALLIAFAALFVADIIVSVLSVIRLNRRLAELDAARQRLRLVSDALGAQLAGGALRAKGRLGLLESRLLAAFPHMRSLRHADALAALTAHQRRLHERWKALGAARSKARRSKR